MTDQRTFGEAAIEELLGKNVARGRKVVSVVGSAVSETRIISRVRELKSKVQVLINPKRNQVLLTSKKRDFM